MKRFNLISKIFVMVAVVVVLAACGRSRSIPDVSGVLDLKGIASTARTYYNNGVQQETTLVNLWRLYEQSMNTFRLGAKDLMANQTSCYKSVAGAESEIAKAVMGTQNSQAIINALQTQSSVSGETATTQCTQLNKQLADYIIANRQSVQDRYMAAFESATKYMQYTSAFPDIKIMNDLMQTFGNLSTVYSTLAEWGIGVSDWTWLPTDNLWITHSDKNLCDYYISGAFKQNLRTSMKNKFAGHDDSLMNLYESSWNPAANGGRGECRMLRYAALEYMTRSIISADTRQNIQSGEDTSVFETPDK